MSATGVGFVRSQDCAAQRSSATTSSVLHTPKCHSNNKISARGTNNTDVSNSPHRYEADDANAWSYSSSVFTAGNHVCHTFTDEEYACSESRTARCTPSDSANSRVIRLVIPNAFDYLLNSDPFGDSGGYIPRHPGIPLRGFPSREQVPTDETASVRPMD